MTEKKYYNVDNVNDIEERWSWLVRSATYQHAQDVVSQLSVEYSEELEVSRALLKVAEILEEKIKEHNAQEPKGLKKGN